MDEFVHGVVIFSGDESTVPDCIELWCSPRGVRRRELSQVSRKAAGRKGLQSPNQAVLLG